MRKGGPPRSPLTADHGGWGAVPAMAKHILLLTLTLTLPAVLLVCLQESICQDSDSSQTLLQTKVHVNY